MKRNTKIVAGQLDEGTYVQMVTTFDDGRVSTSSGKYDGVRLSNGEDYLYFRDGQINGHPQSMFGFPVAGLDADVVPMSDPDENRADLLEALDRFEDLATAGEAIAAADWILERIDNFRVLLGGKRSDN